MDMVDRKILSLLKEDSRMAFADIGKKVNLSAPAVFARVRKMEQQGAIRKFTIDIDPEAVEARLCAFIRIVVKGVTSVEVSRRLEKLPEIQEVHHVAGEDCLVLKVRVKGPLGLNDLLESVKKIEGIERTITSVVLRSEFERGLTPTAG